MSLHPFRLVRRYESRLWGGNQLATWLNLTDAPTPLAETWEVYNDNLIRDGALAGQTLRQAVLIHGADLVGSRSLQRYGHEFPLLAKFIDANQPLSVQVHPDDAYAHRYEAASGFHGKTEAWHIIATSGHNDVIHGLTHAISRDEYAHAIATNTLEPLLRHIPVTAGDTVFVPAGTIHAINAGILLFEIQQTSDITYRLYDFDRVDSEGNKRELHVDLALEAINYNKVDTQKEYNREVNVSNNMVNCPFFTTNYLNLAGELNVRKSNTSFTVYMCTEGAFKLKYDQISYRYSKGDTLLIPAALTDFVLIGKATLLEIYIS
jgi:mannose-6-phosphate isomerase